MIASFRSLCLLGSLTMLAACGGNDDANNLAALDARLTNGAIDPDVLAAVGGTMEKAPAAIESKVVKPGNRTLGDLASQQASAAAPGSGNDACVKSITYGAQWAEKMPEPFRVYPGAKLGEAAGIDKAQCNKLRIISFTTVAGIDAVVDYYYTQAKRAGYDAEHLLSGREHQLGGTRGDAAYVVFARPAQGNLTEVDVVANVL